MRNIKYVVIHCTGSSANATVDSILRYWKYHLGWNNPGYHYIVDVKGNISKLAEHSRVCNGVKGYNQESIHIGYIGGVDVNGKAVDTRSLDQVITILGIVRDLLKVYPNVRILGHRDFKGVVKMCPSFDVSEFLRGCNMSMYIK